MFALFKLKGALEIWKISYCTSKFTTCARHQRSLLGERVPDNLMPSGALLKKPSTS